MKEDAKPEPIKVGLDSWVIQDGNYGNFTRAHRYAFALEGWACEPLTPQHVDAPRARAMRWIERSTYEVVGEVIFASPEWWVLDFGLPIYLKQPKGPGVEAGAWLEGQVEVSIDHFSYFERLAKSPGAPALIYDWMIEQIDLDTAPWIERSPKHFERDRSRQSWKRIGETDAWGGQGSDAYVLHCMRLGKTPRHHL